MRQQQQHTNRHKHKRNTLNTTTKTEGNATALLCEGWFALAASLRARGVAQHLIGLLRAVLRAAWSPKPWRATVAGILSVLLLLLLLLACCMLRCCCVDGTRAPVPTPSPLLLQKTAEAAITTGGRSPPGINQSMKS
jgi:hypothetical protein